MNFLQVAMVIGATSILVTMAGLLIIRTMPSRDGIGWWVISAIQQFMIYSIGIVFFGGEETIVTTVAFFSLQMSAWQALSIGMLLFVGIKSNIFLRFITLFVSIGTIIIAMTTGNGSFAPYIFAIYLALTAFYTAINTLRSKETTSMLNLAAVLLFINGIHWLDFPIMSNVDWFVPIGFLLGLVLVLGVYFALATVALLQFKKITNDSEQKAIHAATHDPLTGVYNRSHLGTLFQEYKTKAEAANGTFILLYLDLDGFKVINDVYGHKAGDLILKVVTKRLKQWLGSKGDVIRIGGDEIVVVNSLRSDRGDDMIYGTSAAQSILKLIEEPIVDGANTYAISASIGGCYFDKQFNELELMLSRADELMYSAKEAGKRRVRFGDIPEKRPVEAPVSEDVAPAKLLTGSGFETVS